MFKRLLFAIWRSCLNTTTMATAVALAVSGDTAISTRSKISAGGVSSRTCPPFGRSWVYRSMPLPHTSHVQNGGPLG